MMTLNSSPEVLAMKTLLLCIVGQSFLLPAYPASFTHNFVSMMQSFYFSESQDALVLQTCHEK